jgi:release factor glutamine methyltransferase
VTRSAKPGGRGLEPLESTVGAALDEGGRSLARAHVESPRLTAELLLAHVLEIDRVGVLTHPEAPLTEGGAAQFGRLLRRAAEGEPLAYITGRREFYGVPLEVTPDVLIPRPETEILVERALRLAARAPASFVDVGTGSGAIAIAFALFSPRSSGWATDVSPQALAVARRNAAAAGAAGRIAFAAGDLLGFFAERPAFDLVLANPPYISASEAAGLPRSVAAYEPPVALFAGDSGLEVFRRLIPQAAARLRPAGLLLVEVGMGQADPVAGLVCEAGLRVEEIVRDLQGIPRCVAARKLDF